MQYYTSIRTYTSSSLSLSWVVVCPSIHRDSSISFGIGWLSAVCTRQVVGIISAQMAVFMRVGCLNCHFDGDIVFPLAAFLHPCNRPFLLSCQFFHTIMLTLSCRISNGSRYSIAEKGCRWYLQVPHKASCRSGQDQKPRLLGEAWIRPWNRQGYRP